MLPVRLQFTLAALALVAAGCQSGVKNSSAGSQSGVQITSLPDRLRIELNGSLFTEYFFRDVPRPYAYPLIGPGDAPMTRNWPMKDVPDEEHDHPHHRSFWFAHGAVNGQDFWSEAKGFGRIVHQRFSTISSGKHAGIIREQNNWVAADGTLVCTDERMLKIFTPASANERSFDFEITLRATDKPVTFGDTKEGSMAIRLAESMRFKGKVGHGHIINSVGDRDDSTWGKRADWCDYYGPVNGKTVGVAMFDHPSNPRHPTWWHVRDYGLFAANPFGRHDFEKLSDRDAGNLTIPPGQSITFRYRFYLHEGDEKAARIAEKYQDYVRTR
jgi:hypothetical protein